MACIKEALAEFIISEDKRRWTGYVLRKQSINKFR